MRIPPSVSLVLPLLLAAGAAGASAAGCGDKVQSGLTGIDVHVTYDADLPVYRLRFSGWLGSAVAFAQEDRPDEDRAPSPDGENLVVLLPSSMSGSRVFIQVDGIDRGGAPLGSSGGAVLVEGGAIKVLEIRLGAPRICGDADIHPEAELCDDANSLSGDGCSSQCVIESEWQCSGQPSACRRCGDGVCALGEDLCSCPEDCASATCGDQLCCDQAGEDCSCPADCGTPECGDDLCCNGEDECRADCGNCGNGRCEIDRGEDACRCPDDCEPGQGECGNGSCCAADDENPAACPQDCCDAPECGDGVCCPTENAEDCPADCCAEPTCNDGVCCPGETAAGCPADCCAENPRCGDGVCCPGAEDANSCAEDCCGQDPPCGDGQCCPGESCDTDGCERCPSCGSGRCAPCCETCEAQACTYACDAGCDCSFDCSAPDQCNVECESSSCFVECGPITSCIVECKGQVLSDAGVNIPGDCACRGGGCLLTCPAGERLRCPDGVTVACSLTACP